MQEAGLGPHLHGHHAGQLQVVELLFKAVAQVHQVVVCLGVLGKTRLLRLPAQLLQLGGADLGQALLAGQNVHGQLLVILQVQLVHLVKHGHILQQGDLMLLQRLGDFVHVGLYLAVLGLHGFQTAAGFSEQARQALLFLVLAEALQLHHQLAQVLADLAQILVADAVQGVFGEACHAFLGGGAILEDHIGVADVDLAGEFLHGLLFLVSQQLVVHLHGLNFLFLLHLGGLRSLGSGGGVQGQLGGHVIGHGYRPSLYH